MRSQAFRLAQSAFGNVSARSYATNSPSSVRHLMSIKDLSRDEFATLVRNASAHKKAAKEGKFTLSGTLAGKTVPMMFSKRSTRTRVSTEAAVTMMGGNPMFLGKDDIQLGVNESLYDTAKVISSMVAGSCMVARVGPHSDVADLAKWSDVPVINALSSDFHPMQIVADYLAIYEAFPRQRSDADAITPPKFKIAWVGDSNNVLFDLAIASVKLGVEMAVASPPGYGVPNEMQELIRHEANASSSPGRMVMCGKDEAIKGANVLVTDTWVSMGQEEETKRRLKAFAGYQITEAMAKAGGADPDWKFMHCLPRHPEEVDDEVFYGPRSLVFPEAENRLWSAIAILEAFVVNKGKIL